MEHIKMKKYLSMPLYPTHKCYCGKDLWKVARNNKKRLETQDGKRHFPEQCQKILKEVGRKK